MRKRIFLGAILCLILVSVLAIALLRLPIGVVEPARSEPIRIGVLPYPGFAPFYIAESEGFFEQEGVVVEIVTIADPTQAISLIASGQVQMLFSSADFTPVIVDSGVDVKEILATDIGFGSDGLLVTEDIQKISDLKGETVYLSIGTPSHFFFRYMMVQDGLDDTDIVIEHMDADQVGAAFVAGKIDYGMSWEPWLSRATERERGKLLLSTRDLPGIVTDTYVVRADTLEEREDEVEAILRAWFDSIDFIKTDRQEAYAIMADQMGLPVEEFGAMAETVRFLDYEASLARFDRSTMFDLYELTDEATRIYMADGLIMSEVSAEEIVEPSVLEGLYD